ncbi:MAG: sugar transferase [bacterium]
MDERDIVVCGVQDATLPADAAGVLGLVAERWDLTVQAPAAWFPVLTVHGGVRGGVLAEPSAGRDHAPVSHHAPGGPAAPRAGVPARRNARATLDCGSIVAGKGALMIRFPAMPLAGCCGCERLLAALLLLLASPLLLLAAMLIRLGDGGPGFFVQERFGRDGRPFRLIKLRTMRREAEAQQTALAARSPAGRSFKLEDDPRATRFGRWLRQHGLDELPQLFNVVRGEMRLVGPRPLPAYEDRHYTQPWQRARLEGLPGLTGLWQVSGRNARTFDEMCQLDIWYLRNRSFMLDLRILARTAAVVWRG